MDKDKLARINNYLGKSCRSLARHAFLSFLVLVSISLIIGGLLFYNYSFLVVKTEPEITSEIAQFEEGLYQKIMTDFQNREGRFEKASTKSYPDPFR